MSVPSPEIQTCIDECADGSWQGSIYVGSVLHVPRGAGHPYIHGSSFFAVAARMDDVIRELRDGR